MSLLAYIVLLAAAAPALSHPAAAAADDIPVVRVKQTHSMNNLSYSLLWYPVNTTNENNPVIGIKVKMWKVPCVLKTYYNNTGDGKWKVVVSDKQTYNRTGMPDEVPEYVAIVKADQVTAIIPHIEKEQWYHVRVLAFTATAEGKHSDSITFKLVSNDENDKKRECERVVSTTRCESTLILPESDDC